MPAFPKPGVSLEFVLRSGHTLTCEVVRADWSEEKALFVLSCTYSKRSIAEGDYLALINDPDWTVRQLLPE